MALNDINGTKGSKRPFKGSGKNSRKNDKTDTPVFDKNRTPDARLKALLNSLEKKLDSGDIGKEANNKILEALKEIKTGIDQGETPKNKGQNTDKIFNPGKSIPSSPYGPITGVPMGRISNNFFPGVPELKPAGTTPTGIKDLSGMGAITGVPLGELPQGLAPGVPKME